MNLSIAGWSLWRHFRKQETPHLALVDFAPLVKERYGVDAVELNSPFFDSTDAGYLHSVVAAANKAGVKLLNIAVDEQGDLASEDPAARELGLASYGKWIDVAAAMGIKAIRCNSGGKTLTDKAAGEQHCIESFKQLAGRGAKAGVKILIENHWGISSDPEVVYRIVTAVQKSAGAAHMAALPDYGNWPPEVDRYAALQRVLPLAGAVHAKVLEVTDDGIHAAFDLARCVALTRAAGYDGYLGIEYEGPAPQLEGLAKAVKLMRKVIA